MRFRNGACLFDGKATCHRFVAAHCALQWALRFKVFTRCRSLHQFQRHLTRRALYGSKGLKKAAIFTGRTFSLGRVVNSRPEIPRFGSID